jgi:flagellar protein FliS
MSEALGFYRRLELGSSSREVVVLRLFEAALRHCRSAREHQREGRVRERSQAASKALAIVGELQRVLDFERGGEIARELDRLYLFVCDRLVDACLQGRAEAFDEALRVLEPLCEGWSAIAARPPGTAP